MIKTRRLLLSLLYLLGKKDRQVPVDVLLRAVEEFSKLYPDEFDRSVLEVLNELRREGFTKLDLPYVRITEEGFIKGLETFSKVLEEDSDKASALLLASRSAQKFGA